MALLKHTGETLWLTVYHDCFALLCFPRSRSCFQSISACVCDVVQTVIPVGSLGQLTDVFLFFVINIATLIAKLLQKFLTQMDTQNIEL